MGNMYLKRITVFFTALLLVIYMAGPVYVYAADIYEAGSDEDRQITITRDEGGSLKYTYRVLKDIEIRGISGESKWFFDVDKELEVRDFKFNLYCRISPIIIRELSYITVYLNDLPIQSICLKDDNDNLAKNWVVEIPADKVITGYNELKIRTYTRISYAPCEPDEHIANWVIIDGNTNYVITYNKKPLYNQICDFPKPFIGTYADDSQGIGVVIPDSYSNDELSAALTLISHMKADQPGYQVNTTLVTAGDQQVGSFDSIIYIGSFKGMPENLKSLVHNSPTDDMNNANIYRAASGDNGKPVFIIASDNGKSLMNAVKALSNSQIKEQMTFDHYTLPPDFDTIIKETKDEDYIYLKSLGLTGIKVEGIKRQVTTIGIRIPFNEVLADGSSINLNIRYSDNIDYDKSMVSAYINGIPVSSERLDKGKRDLHTIKMPIPKECRNYNYYDIRVEFYLIPSGEITCERYLTGIPWAYIQEDSYFYMPKQERSIMQFENLPYPFSRDNDLDATTIVLPDNPKSQDLIIAGRIAELLGIGVKKNQGIINAARGKAFTDMQYSDNLVIFGCPGENSAIKAVNDNLWFKFNELFTAVLSNEKFELLPETSKTAAFFELKTSPYNDEKGMLTITSMEKKSIQDSITYFKDDKRGLLTGDAAIVRMDGELATLRFQKAENNRPIIDSSNITSKDIWNYIIFAGAVLLLMAVGFAFYLYKSNKGRRNKSRSFTRPEGRRSRGKRRR